LGEYGATPAEVDADLQKRVVEEGDHDVITGRPADLLPDEMQRLTGELQGLAMAKDIKLVDSVAEDVLIHALFPQVGLKFLENRGNSDAFEPAPTGKELELPHEPPTDTDGTQVPEMYHVSVNGNTFEVQVSTGGEVRYITPVEGGVAPAAAPAAAAPAAAPATGGGEAMPSPLAGTVFKVMVKEGQQVAADDVLIVLEAMKMETEIRSLNAGTVSQIAVKEGDAVTPGQALVYLS